jgi:coenzyme F420 hydrogenase subunit beta
MGEIQLPSFLECGFARLKREVIDANRCTFCGTCIAFCPKIKEGDERPEFVEEYDTLCGMCYAFCPRTFLDIPEIEMKIFGEMREDEQLGVYKGCFAARSKRSEILKNAQDGGVVTSLFAYALEGGIIDSAIVAKDEDWKPISIFAENYEDLLRAAGTKYTSFPNVIGIKRAIDAGYSKIGFVGLPCQIQGIRKVQTSEEPYQVGKEKIKLLIGLFCMESFPYGNFTDFIRELGVDIKEVEKFEIKSNRFFMHGEDTTQIVALEELKSYANEACAFCKDFTAELADISIGSVGSPDGWSTVLIRSRNGEKIFTEAEEEGYIEVKEIEESGVNLVKRLSDRKKKRGWKNSI